MTVEIEPRDLPDWLADRENLTHVFWCVWSDDLTTYGEVADYRLYCVPAGDFLAVNGRNTRRLSAEEAREYYGRFLRTIKGGSASCSVEKWAQYAIHHDHGEILAQAGVEIT